MKKSSTDIILDVDAGLVYLPKAKALMKLGYAPKNTPESSVKIDYNQTPYHPWGDSNDTPDQIKKKVEKNSIIPSTLMWKANQMSAGGMVYGTVSGTNADGTEKFERISVPEIDDWLEANAPELYLEECLRDLYWWANTYADLYLTPNRKKIASLVIQEAMDCRFSKQNPKTGRKDFVYVDGNWPIGTAATWTQVNCLDPYFGVQDQIANSKPTRFIYPMSFSSPGEKYYQRASWHSIIDSGWLDVAEKIPVFKKSLMDNQMSIKYVIHVPESWWKWKYKNWDKLNDAQKKQCQTDELTEFNKVLTGVKNVGKTLMLTFKHDAYGKNYTKWEVIPLNDKIQTGAYTEDSQEASSHILYSLLVDGTLIGSSPGRGNAGSGSDKFRANNIFILSNKVYIEKALTPMKIITKYNGWTGPKKAKIAWRGLSYHLATLDTGKAMKADVSGNSAAA